MKNYTIFVEFAESLDGIRPVTQTLHVRSNSAEFNVLLQCLNESANVVSLEVHHKPLMAARETYKITKEDLGYDSTDIMKKLK